MKLRSVQVLRAVAVLAVVLFHYGSIKIGKSGVDLFFVISGFIMVHVMPGKSPLIFARDRIWRIFPTYWAATALLLALPGTGLDSRLWSSILLVPGSNLYLPQAWTLTFELTFYSGCAAYLAWGRKALLLLPLAYLSERLYHTPYTGIAASPLFLEFLMGCLIAKLPRINGIWPVAGAIATFVLLSGLDRSLAYGIPSALLLYGCVNMESRFLKWAVPVLIGDASYSIYLTHWTLMAHMPQWSYPGFWLVSAYLSVLFGVAFYLAVERPLNQFKPWASGLFGARAVE